MSSLNQNPQVEPTVRGKTDEAIGVLKQATQLKPSLVEPHLNLGVTYFKAARYGDARASLARAVSLAPRNVQARQLLALSLIALENFREAVVHLEVLYAALVTQSDRRDASKSLGANSDSGFY